MALTFLKSTRQLLSRISLNSGLSDVSHGQAQAPCLLLDARYQEAYDVAMSYY